MSFSLLELLSDDILVNLAYDKKVGTRKLGGKSMCRYSTQSKKLRKI
jgi:hypothetical protein